MNALMAQGQLIATVAAPLTVALLCLYARSRRLGGTYLLLWALAQIALSLTFLAIALSPPAGHPTALPAGWRIALFFWYCSDTTILAGVLAMIDARVTLRRGLAAALTATLLMVAAGFAGGGILLDLILPLQPLLVFVAGGLLLWRRRSGVYVLAGAVQMLRAANGMLYVHAVQQADMMLLPDYTSPLSVFVNFLAGVSLLAIAVENAWLRLGTALEEARFSEAVMDLAPVSIVRKDRNLKIVRANRYFADHVARFEHGRESVLGARSGGLMPSDGAGAMESLDRQLLADPGCGPLEREVTMTPADGAPVTLLVRKAAAVDEAGHAAGIVSASLDITRLKTIEHELRRQIALTEAASRAKSSFLAHMSHELRTPLNGIIGFAEMIDAGYAGPLSERQQAYMADILAASRHMLALVCDILLLTEQDDGSATMLPRAPVDLGAVVAAATAAAAGAAAAAGVALAAQPQPVTVEADRAALARVLGGLIDNAIRFNRPGGRVEVAQLAVDGRPAVRISDTGIGMGAAELAAAGDPFPSRDPLRAAGGAGLGLAVSRALVGRLGGRLDIASRPGEGTIVTVVL
jgi:signal transduction histidine kinase